MRANDITSTTANPLSFCRLPSLLILSLVHHNNKCNVLPHYGKECLVSLDVQNLWSRSEFNRVFLEMFTLLCTHLVGLIHFTINSNLSMPIFHVKCRIGYRAKQLEFNILAINNTCRCHLMMHLLDTYPNSDFPDVDDR